MSDKSDKSERSARGVFDELVDTWRSQIFPDDGGSMLEDGFIDIEVIEEVNPARGIIRKGKRRPPTSGGTGGGEFDIADSIVKRGGIIFTLEIRRPDGGPQSYDGVKFQGGNTAGGKATFVSRDQRGRDNGQEQGTWIATKGG